MITTVRRRTSRSACTPRCSPSPRARAGCITRPACSSAPAPTARRPRRRRPDLVAGGDSAADRAGGGQHGAVAHAGGVPRVLSRVLGLPACVRSRGVRRRRPGRPSARGHRQDRPPVAFNAGNPQFNNNIADAFRFAINPPNRGQINPVFPDLVVERAGGIAPGSDPSCPQAISVEDPGVLVTNYRMEPVGCACSIRTARAGRQERHAGRRPARRSRLRAAVAHRPRHRPVERAAHRQHGSTARASRRRSTRAESWPAIRSRR